MAERWKFVCSHCSKAIKAWSDGNPYFLDENGAKQYAYHPDHERLARCIGNDITHICLSCGLEFKVDSRDLIANCPGCTSAEMIENFKLAGRICPYCKSGELVVDLSNLCIS